MQCSWRPAGPLRLLDFKSRIIGTKSTHKQHPLTATELYHVVPAARRTYSPRVASKSPVQCHVASFCAGNGIFGEPEWGSRVLQPTPPAADFMRGIYAT